MTLLGRSASPAARGRAFIALGLAHLDQGRHADAAACFTRFLRIQQVTGSVRGQAEVRYRSAPYASARAATARRLTAAMRSAIQSGDLMIAMPAQIRLGQTLIQVGRLDEARSLLEDAIRHLSPEGAPRFRAIALEALGQLHGAQDRLEEAAPLIAEAQGLRQALAALAR